MLGAVKLCIEHRPGKQGSISSDTRLGGATYKKVCHIAELLIRKFGSFIRLRRVILLRSDIRLMPSVIRYASFGGE